MFVNKDVILDEIDNLKRRGYNIQQHCFLTLVSIWDLVLDFT